MDRRSFVKGSIGASLLGVGGAAGLGMGKPLAITGGTKAVKVEFLGAKRVGGPAPRGLPVLPLELDSEGNLLGKVEEFSGGRTNLPWYQYCGHEAAPGLDPEKKMDPTITYFITPDKIAQGFNPWYADLVGKPMNKDHFPEDGFGAAGQWRSEGMSGSDVITTILIRTGTDLSNIAGTGKPLNLNEAGEFADMIKTSVEETGFLGFVSFCSHFCCVPGWKEADKKLSDSKNAWDALFCTCHFSVYDPTELTVDSFLQIIKEDDGEGGSGGGGGGGGH